MSAPDVMHVRFRLTAEQVQRYTMGRIEMPEWRAATRADRWRAVRRSLLLVPVWPLAAVGMIELLSRFTDAPRDHLRFSVFIGLVAAVAHLIVTLPLGRYRTSRLKQLEQMAEQITLPGRIGIVELSIALSGLTYRLRFESSSHMWADVTAVVLGPGGLAIHVSTGGEILIPRETILTGQTIEQVHEQVASFWNEQDAHSKLISAFLSDHEIACPACKYTLCGVSEAKCPECGANIKLEHLRGASPPSNQTSTASGLTPDSSSTRSA
ncbi:MAG: hypothetical protein AAFN41_08455 [Planctomycetota bacterium]